jgi:hypothetical protein
VTENTREVQLPEELCRAAEQRYGAQFGNLERLLEYLLQNLVRDDAARMDEAEQRMIEERLKNLGYI